MLRDKVLIEPDKVPKLSDIILLPEDTEIKPPAVGLVLAVGPEVAEVAEGDTVHFERFDWCVAPGDLIILKESEVLSKEIK